MRAPGSESARAPAWLFFFLSGHIVQYVGLLLSATAGEEFRYVTFAGAALQIASSAFMLPAVFRRTTVDRLLYMVLLLLFVILGINGYGRGNWSSYLLNDLLTFGLFVNAASAVREDILDRLGRLYSWLLLPGLIVAASLVTQLDAATMDQRFGGTLETNAFYIPLICSPGALILLRPSLERWEFVAATAAMLLTVLFGVLTATRSMVLFVALVAAFRVMTTRGSKGRLGLLIPLLIVAGTIISAVWSPDAVGGAARTLVGRFDTEEDFSTGRDDEASAFLRVLSFEETVWGRGMGGSYVGVFKGNYLHGMHMVHYGHLHLMLKGGVLFLSVIGLLLALSAWRGWRTKTTSTRTAAGLIVVFIAMNATHTQFEIQPLLALLGPAIGVALSFHRLGPSPRARVIRAPSRTYAV